MTFNATTNPSLASLYAFIANLNTTGNLHVNNTTSHILGNTTNAKGNRPNMRILSYVILLMSLTAFALLGNLVVIIVFFLHRRPRVSSNYYIFSLAVSDVITAALVMTLEVDQMLNNHKWRHSKLLRKVWTTGYLLTVPVSILTARVSSIDRWYAISRPLLYRINRNGIKHKALAAILFVWMYSILFALVPVMGWNPPDKRNNSNYCYFDIYFEYSILSSAVNFILPSFVTAFFYYHMFKAMKRHTMRRRKMLRGSHFSQRSPHKNRREDTPINFRHNVSLAKSYTLIGSLLIITWCPYTIFSVAGNICMALDSRSSECRYIPAAPNILSNSLLMLGYSTSALNPLVYVLRFRQFRLTLRELLTSKKR